MRFNYLDVIAQSDEKYRKSLSYIVSILIFSFFIFFAAIKNKHNLIEYHRTIGYIDEIKKDKIKVKSKALYNFKSHVYSEVISIKVNNEYYYVDKESKSRWDSIINSISEDDFIIIHYKFFENYKIVSNLRNREHVILSINDLKERQSIFLKVLFFIMLIFLIILGIIINKRIIWLKLK